MTPKNRILAVACALLAAAGLLAYLYVRHSGEAYVDAARMLNARRTKAGNFARKNFNDRYDNPVLALVEKRHAASPGDTAAYCRNLIYANSDKGYVESYKEDVAVMYALLARSLDSGVVQLSLKCDGRAYLLRNMLAHVGIRSRIVHGLYREDSGEVVGHTFLEVQDGPGGAWVVQDPYFDLSFVSRATGRPAGLLDLCAQDLDAFRPAPGSRAESIAETGRFFSRIYSVAVYDKREQGAPSVVLLNLRKLGAADMAEFLAAPRFAGLRRYLSGKWYDYAAVDL